MKRNLVVSMMMVFVMVLVGSITPGCITSTGDKVMNNLSLSEDQVLAYTDGAYTVARAIISTPEVWEKINETNKLKLQDMEKLYLLTREKHLKASGEDTKLIDTLILTADELITIMECVPALSQYATKIRIAKATVETFKRMLTVPEILTEPEPETVEVVPDIEA